MVLAAIHTGIGHEHVSRICGILDMPSCSNTTWAGAEDRVHDACLAVGQRSMERALAEERTHAWRAEQGRSEGRPMPTEKVGITISADMQWLKPGRAHNAPDGYAVAIGAARLSTPSTRRRSAS